MTDYVKLVDKILKVSALSEALSNPDPTILDLVSSDWKERLENNVLYQEYVADSKTKFRAPTLAKTEVYEVQKIHNPDHFFRVRLAAKCLIPNPYESGKKERSFDILLQESEALKMIVNTMTKDLTPEYQFDDISKVGLDFCSYLNCIDCNTNLQVFRGLGLTVADEYQTCIRNTKVFDGKNVVNRFGTQIKNMFKGPFIGIVELELNARYFYKNKNEEKIVRIAGKVLNLLALREVMLNPKGTVYLGDLASTTQDMFNTPNGKKRPYEEEELEDEFLSDMPTVEPKEYDFEDSQAFP